MCDDLKKTCAIVLHIQEPCEMLQKLAIFFRDRKIMIETLTMHRYRSGDAMVIIHCQIERDRVNRTAQLLKKLNGVSQLEILK